MKMISRQFCCSLNVISLTGLVSCSPVPDLEISLGNSTQFFVRLCGNLKKVNCETIPPDEAVGYLLETDDKAKEYWRDFVSDSVVEICGQDVPLKNILGKVKVRRSGHDFVAYEAQLSGQKISAICQTKK
jgi:hypothetical protein